LKAAKFAIFGLGRKNKYEEEESADMLMMGADDTEHQIENLEKLRDFDDK
jgi:hypothetical protein